MLTTLCILSVIYYFTACGNRLARFSQATSRERPIEERTTRLELATSSLGTNQHDEKSLENKGFLSVRIGCTNISDLVRISAAWPTIRAAILTLIDTATRKGTDVANGRPFWLQASQ